MAKADPACTIPPFARMALLAAVAFYENLRQGQPYAAGQARPRPILHQLPRPSPAAALFGTNGPSLVLFVEGLPNMGMILKTICFPAHCILGLAEQ